VSLLHDLMFQFERALPRLEVALKIYPDNTSLLLLVQRAMNGVERSKAEQEQLLKRALKNEPSNVGSAELRGALTLKVEVLFANGQFSEDCLRDDAAAVQFYRRCFDARDRATVVYSIKVSKGMPLSL
jgi:hypothetical protein